MKCNFIKVKEVDGLELYINKPIVGRCVCGEDGHFEDINTGENLGRDCEDYMTYFDSNLQLLPAPVKSNVRWVRDDG